MFKGLVVGLPAIAVMAKSAPAKHRSGPLEMTVNVRVNRNAEIVNAIVEDYQRNGRIRDVILRDKL
jgi:hypothetical protein